MINFSYLIFFIILIPVSHAFQCPQSQYPVSSHPRASYYRHDGTYVKDTTVRESCRYYKTDKALIIKFRDQMPAGWPFRKEKFKKWTEKEKKSIEKALEALPVFLELNNRKSWRIQQQVLPRKILLPFMTI